MKFTLGWREEVGIKYVKYWQYPLVISILEKLKQSGVRVYSEEGIGILIKMGQNALNEASLHNYLNLSQAKNTQKWFKILNH